MVRRILSRLTAPIRGLHQAAYLLAGLTLASQLLALIRDRVFAHMFGASQTLDLYYAAFKVPDLVYALVVSLVSAYVLIPNISERIEKEGRESARRLISQAATFLFFFGGALCIVIALFAPTLLRLLFPILMASAHQAEFVFLARILLIQPILLGLSSVLSSVTQIERRFVLFAMSPVLYNLGIILGTIFLYPHFGLIGIGIGVIGGAILHLLLHIPVVLRAGLMPMPTIPRLRELLNLFAHSLPRSLALAMSSLTTLLLIALASRSGEGGVSVYVLAGNLEAVPLSLIAASYATAAFPVMAEQAGGGKYDAFKATVTVAARHIVFWSSVITVLTIVLRAHIVRIILGSGAFDWNDTRLTAAILAVLIVGLLAQGLILLCARAFYAAGRSWNPLFVQLGDAGVSVAVAYALVHAARVWPMLQYFMEALLRIEDVPGSPVLFIALGYTVGQFVMLAVALLTLRVVAPGVARSLMRPLFEGLGAAILGGAATYAVLAVGGTIAPLTRLPVVFAEGLIAGMVGLFVAGFILWLLENQEFRDLTTSLRKLTSFKALAPHELAHAHDHQDP
ncbi:MAG TPA: lipid II flippase MurJ [Candidatus Paceibacterota bacterium]|nr:lipid II flippase MurJ [Candidatus Paceibacterota bacterium]